MKVEYLAQCLACIKCLINGYKKSIRKGSGFIPWLATPACSWESWGSKPGPLTWSFFCPWHIFWCKGYKPWMRHDFSFCFPGAQGLEIMGIQKMRMLGLFSPLPPQTAWISLSLGAGKKALHLAWWPLWQDGSSQKQMSGIQHCVFPAWLHLWVLVRFFPSQIYVAYHHSHVCVFCWCHLNSVTI